MLDIMYMSITRIAAFSIGSVMAHWEAAHLVKVWFGYHERGSALDLPPTYL